MLVLVPSATHIWDWEMLIPGGGVHCHWKEPSLATVQERLVADTTLSGPGGTGGSMELGCRNEIDVVGRETNVGGNIKTHIKIANCNLSCYCASGSQDVWLVIHFLFLLLSF